MISMFMLRPLLSAPPLLQSCDPRGQSHSSGHSNSSLSIASCRDMGFIPSTVQPTALAVPRTSFTVPLNSLERLLLLICRQTSKICSFVRSPLCLIFLVFLRSLSGSFNCLMMRLVALGSMSTLAARFWMVSLTVTRMPFHAPVPFTMSSPTFLGDMPRGPTFGANTEEGACSPPYCLNVTIFTSFASNLGAILAKGGWPFQRAEVQQR